MEVVVRNIPNKFLVQAVLFIGFTGLHDWLVAHYIVGKKPFEIYLRFTDAQADRIKYKPLKLVAQSNNKLHFF